MSLTEFVSTFHELQYDRKKIPREIFTCCPSMLDTIQLNVYLTHIGYYYHRQKIHRYHIVALEKY